MKVVVLGDYQFGLPDNWSECTGRQLEEFVVFGFVEAGMRDRQFWEAVVKTALGCSEDFWKSLVLSIEQFDLLKRLCGWIFELKLDVRPMESFSHAGILFLWPAAEFGDSTAVEVAIGAMNYLAFTAEEPDVKALDKLVAVFCRPPLSRQALARHRASELWDGDVRERFVEQRYLERAEVLAGLPILTKLLFLRWFEHELQVFMDSYEVLFGGSVAEPRYEDNRGWLMILKGVAAKGYLGTIDEVHRRNVHEVWSYLLDDYLDIKQLEHDKN